MTGETTYKTFEIEGTIVYKNTIDYNDCVFQVGKDGSVKLLNYGPEMLSPDDVQELIKQVISFIKEN